MSEAIPSPSSPRRGALRVTGVYALMAAVWIAGGDLALQVFAGVERSLTMIEIAKGMAFVVVSSVALYLLVHRQLAAQRALVERRVTDEQWFRALVENADEVFSVLDVEGKPLYRSPAFQRILGYDSVEASSITFTELIHPSDRGVAQRELDRILRMPYRTTPRLWLRLKAKDGSWRVCEAVGTNLLAHPAVGGIVVNWRERVVPEPERD